jgi:hypothetical protein
MNIGDIKKKHLLLALSWCQKKWNKSEFKRTFPKLSLTSKRKNFYGIYLSRSNLIIISKPRHNSAIDIFGTVIHEYTHYLQNMEKYSNYQYKNKLKHPYEKTAMNREIKYRKELKNYVKQFNK